MFLVTAIHTFPGISHISSATVLLTNDGTKAIKAARDIEQLGYKFVNNGEVTIAGYCPEHPYARDEEHNHPRHGDLGLVYVRKYTNGEWTEKWHCNDAVKNKILGIKTDESKAA
jgi:hypothetical protein